MKLTVILIFLNVLQVSAKVTAQEKVTLQLNKITIGEILNTIEDQGHYRFVYNSNLKDIRLKTSINARDASITDVMDRLLDGTNLLYNILDDNLIVLRLHKPDQDIVVKGKVMDANGNPLPGVSVSVKGTNQGVMTDVNGDFSISAPEKGVLVFSFVGFQSQEVAITGEEAMNVILEPSAATQQLEEVVVIGYGTASKRDLTGSIVKVDGKEVADKPNVNPVASLQAKVAGLSVVNNGTPGKAPDIRVRGTVSLGQVHPLYVVDGILNDNIDYINPNDIESIEVLKDPSSLAIFGVRGATGVIAITTKKAKAGQSTINFNATYGIKKLVDKIKLANSEEFKTLFAEERANLGITDPYDYTGLTANTDWIDAVTQTGRYNAYNLGVAGGSEKNKFNFGLGYIMDDGIVVHERQKKILLSFNDEFRVTNGIKMGVNLNASRTNNPYDATWVLDAARKVVPMVSPGTKNFYVKDPYGPDSLNMDIYSALNTGLQTSGVVNPLVEVENEWNRRKSIEYRTVGSVFADISFTKDLTFRTTFYADMSNVNFRRYRPLYYAYNPVNEQPELANSVTSISENDDTYRKFQQDYILTYKKRFGEHNLTATAGVTSYYFGQFSRTANARQGNTAIPDDPRFWYINSGLFVDPESRISGSNQSEYTTLSYLARFLYNYKGKYYLNGSLRNDASSRLPPQNRNQLFWALGAAWEISEESFMENQQFFDFLKLKGSIGVLGNQSAVSGDGVTTINYPYFPQLRSGVSAVFGTNVLAAAFPDWERNPDLKWETIHANEIGIEFNAFQNRLHFEANYFNRTTKDLVIFVDRATLGLPNKLVNGGSIRNWGQEFMASWNQEIAKNFSINIGGNITFLKNKVLNLTSEIPTGRLMRGSQNNNAALSVTQAGMPIGFFYGYVVEGLYQSDLDVLQSPAAISIGGAHPGDLKYKDISGPDGKPDGQITADDRVMIGNPTPDFTYGASIALNYKGFSLGIDVGGVYGNEVFRSWGSLESGFQRVNYPAYKLNRWHGAGTSNWDPVLNEGHTINKHGSTYNIEDGSYFRIRNIQLSYSFSQSLMSELRMKGIRVFVNVQNLKTWKNNSGYTAEFGGDATSFGYDVAGGAIPVVGTAGINVTF